MWIADIYHLLYVLALRKKGKTVLCFGALAEHLFTTGSLQAIPRWLFDWLVCADDDGLLNAHSSATAINNSTMAGAASNAGSMTVHISVKSDDETCDLGQLFAGVTKHIRANERGETGHTTHARNRNKNMLKNVVLRKVSKEATLTSACFRPSSIPPVSPLFRHLYPDGELSIGHRPPSANGLDQLLQQLTLDGVYNVPTTDEAAKERTSDEAANSAADEAAKRAADEATMIEEAQKIAPTTEEARQIAAMITSEKLL